MSDERRAGERLSDPLLDSPVGENNYLPERGRGDIRAEWLGERILSLSDYVVTGREADLTGGVVAVYVSPEKRAGVTGWWRRAGGAEIGKKELGEKQKMRLKKALEAGLPPFLAVHYAAVYPGDLDFGGRYVGAKHIGVIGLPDSGKTPMAWELTRRIEGGAEMWSLETKYGDLEAGKETFGLISAVSHENKKEQRVGSKDDRLSAGKLLDKKLEEMAERSKREGMVKVCIWDTPGLPRLEIKDGVVDFLRPTDPLDLIVALGTWSLVFFVSRPLVWRDVNGEINRETEDRRLNYFIGILKEKGIKVKAE